MIPQQTRLSIWCERVIEAGWLLALTLIPIYFNLLSARHFEPDKATTLRALVLLMAAVGLIRVLEMMNAPGRRSSTDSSAPQSSNPLAGFWRMLNSVPLALPALAYALVFMVTTLSSVVPHTSFWGSYQRLQGTYTNLSYIMLFFLIVATLRRREQFERLILVTMMTGLVVSGYGFLQHLQLDPLPWRGDVITRVASTMGNSIFVSAYLIMIVPLALYRLAVNTNAARHASPSPDTRSDLLWAGAQALLIVGTLALLLSVIKFGAAVRTVDFRYWWVFPGAIIVSTGLWVLLAQRPRIVDGRSTLIFWPGIVFGVYMLFFWPLYSISANSQMQMVAQDMERGLDWALWMGLSAAAIVAAYALAFFAPRRAPAPSRLTLSISAAANGVLVILMIITIIFSQSRGPFLGLGAGLFIFFLVLLLRSIKQARAVGNTWLSSRLRIVLWSVVGLTALAASFLIVFNVSRTPFFNELREVPYIGRMGTLLETRFGTGRVRLLIWAGDEHAGGAVELITADPLRSLVGWGPESMFVAYNPFYPPSLAQIESRGASPDRSHQAILDELVTKGLVGLISYFFVLISFGLLCWRLIQRSTAWHWQVFFTACLAIIVAHFVEGLTGIPIVSTLMMFWVTLALTVTGGMIAGHYVIGTTAPVEDEPATEAAADAPAEADPPKRKQRGSRRPTAGRGAAVRGPRSPQPGATNPVALLLYGTTLVLTLGAVWWFNLSTIYADMRFHEGQAFSSQSQNGLQEQIIALDKFIETINSNPREDFYYLNLGRTLMTIASIQQSQGMPAGAELPDADAQTVLDLGEIEDVAQFVQSTPPLGMMSYAEAVLLRARDLNDRNKDHYANLARLNNFWYNWTQDPERLRQASEWYQEANTAAPQDVTLLNEHASVLLLMGSYAQNTGDQDTADMAYAQAQEILEHSQALDPAFGDTTTRLAEVYRLRGDLTAATELYIEALASNPHALDGSAGAIIASLEAQPALLLRLRDAYMTHAADTNDEFLYSLAGLMSVRAGDIDGALPAYAQAVELNPNDIENLRNYTIVLSDTQEYGEALERAQAGLVLAQEQEREQEAAQFQFLISILQPKVAGGQ